MKHDEKQKCQCFVPRNPGWYGGNECWNKAKGTLADGTPACGVHMAAERRREQNANKGAEETRKEREFADEVRALLEPLNISGHATGYRHRQLICSFDDFKRVLDKMRNCENCDAAFCKMQITPTLSKQDFYKEKQCIDENRNKWSMKQ